MSDSSRYFTLKITSDDGRNAFVGMGFGDRSDSFDMNVALQDHFKQDEAEKTQEALNEGKIVDDTPKLDLSLRLGNFRGVFFSSLESFNSRPDFFI